MTFDLKCFFPLSFSPGRMYISLLSVNQNLYHFWIVNDFTRPDCVLTISVDYLFDLRMSIFSPCRPKYLLLNGLLLYL